MPEPQIEQTYWNDFEEKISGQKISNPPIVDIQLQPFSQEPLSCLRLGYTTQQFDDKNLDKLRETQRFDEKNAECFLRDLFEKRVAKQKY